MLTPELVRARVSEGELCLVRLSPKMLARAHELAAQYLALASEHVGSVRDELRQMWELLPVTPGERRLADGLLKLVEDCCEFEAELELPPPELRRDVFLAASASRRGLQVGQTFDRSQVLQNIAERYGTNPERIESALYADLKGAQKLERVEAVDAGALVERYQLGQVQAVLLRAVKVSVDVRFDSPHSYRHLFNKLKFRRLLYSIEPTHEGYRIHLDGPFSMFESVTKYGLQLALMLPALLECNELKLRAELSWGKQRKRLKFSFEHKGGGMRAEAPTLSDDVERLRSQLLAKPGPWKIDTCTDVLNLPGVGVCVPDLVFQKGSRRVYLEALGYWSRDAVWRRVELAKAGLGERVLFAVSSRLRVSETVLDAEHAALYVYKGVMSPPQVLKRVEALARS